MPTMPARSPLTALLALLSFVACQARGVRIASSIPIPAGETRALRLSAPRPTDLSVELWNEGPGGVRCRRLEPAGELTADATLAPDRGELRLTATTTELLVELTADGDAANVRYTARSAGSLKTEVLQR
jgi:hypothetical protein